MVTSVLAGQRYFIPKIISANALLSDFFRLSIFRGAEKNKSVRFGQDLKLGSFVKSIWGTYRRLKNSKFGKCWITDKFATLVLSNINVRKFLQFLSPSISVNSLLFSALKYIKFGSFSQKFKFCWDSTISPFGVLIARI